MQTMCLHSPPPPAPLTNTVTGAAAMTLLLLLLLERSVKCGWREKAHTRNCASAHTLSHPRRARSLPTMIHHLSHAPLHHKLITQT